MRQRPGPDDGYKFFKGCLVGLVLVAAIWFILAMIFGVF